MKLAIIDPGYDHPHAHHQTVNLAIHRALLEKDVQVTVLAGQALDQSARCVAQSAGMNAIPYFSVPCYPPRADSLPRRQHQVLAESFAHELRALFEIGLLEGGEHLVLHTGYSFHIAGLARALWHLQDRFTGRILISMMFHPGARLRLGTSNTNEIEFFDAREYLRHKQALQLLYATSSRSGIEITLATPCRAYQRVYQELWPTKVQVHPAVCYRPLSPIISAKKSDRPRVLLYLGGAKEDKGIEFAARLGAAAAEALPQAEFIFHFNNDFPGANRFAALIDDLHRAGEKHHNVEILAGNLDAQRYDAVLQSVQIVCVLYDPVHYGFKTSGVLWDALRCVNIDWLVTEQTWPAAELAELGIPHAEVGYGDVWAGVARLGELLNQRGKRSDGEQLVPDLSLQYLRLLNSSFGEWLYQQFTSKTFNRRGTAVAKINPAFQADRGRILVVRTHYGHFSPLSGPGGFIPYLRGLGYAVDEKLVPLGAEKLKNVSAGLREEFTQLAHGYLRSYQGNAVAAETQVQRDAHRYDVVHFLDAEHCGLLSALYNLRLPLSRSTRFIATYHQPKSILQQIIANPDYLRGFDRIHLMSPCQSQFFEPVVGASRLCVVPHGIAPELLGESLPSLIVGLEAQNNIPGFENAVRGRQILLTVGNWLRDFDNLLRTAQLMATRDDIVFVVVSKGLTLDTQHTPNVLVLNQGITDVQLHALYLRATLLFLPLQDGTANNAILEAMAHGLPIVTTDLPSTRFYTQGQATLSPADPAAYARVLESALTEIALSSRRKEVANVLRERAMELVWRNVAIKMHDLLYAPLIAANAKGRSA